MSVIIEYIKSICHRRRWTILTLPTFLAVAVQFTIRRYLSPTWSPKREDTLVLFLVCLAVAQFLAWNEEYKKISLRDISIKEKDEAISHLRAETAGHIGRIDVLDREIKSLSVPKFSSQITWGALGRNDEVNGSHMALRVLVENKGAHASTIPSAWRAVVTTKDGTEYKAQPITIGNDPQEFCISTGRAYSFVRADGMDRKGQSGIPRLSCNEGVLCFLMQGLSVERLLDDDTHIRLVGQPVNGAEFSATVSIKTLRSRTETVFLPGFTNPHPVPSQKCK